MFLYILLINAHWIMALITFFVKNPKRSPGGALVTLDFAAMLLNIYMITLTSIFVEHERPIGTKGLPDRPFIIWLHIELTVFISIIIGNMIFLFLRSIFNTAIVIDLLDDRKKLPNVDTIIVD